MIGFTRRRVIWALASASVMLPLAAAAKETDWPTKPLTIIVPYAPGGSTDTLARKIAAGLGNQLGQSVIVQNVDGAGGTLGAATAAQAAPDGYTLFFGQISSHGIAPALYQSLNYDPVESFAPIIRVYSVPNVLVVPASFPADDYAGFVKEAGSRKLRFASSGVGSSIHLSGELYKLASGFDMVHVPFRGSGEAMPALLGGNVDLMFDNAPSAIPQTKSGGLKALAVTTSMRSDALPDVPTLQEVGGDALKDFSVQAWFGIFAPAGTEPAIIERANAELNKLFESDDFKTFAASQAAIIDGGSPQDLADHVDRELTKWKGVVEGAGIQKQ